jgi:hypothetical protein
VGLGFLSCQGRGTTNSNGFRSLFRTVVGSVVGGGTTVILLDNEKMSRSYLKEATVM